MKYLIWIVALLVTSVWTASVEKRQGGGGGIMSAVGNFFRVSKKWMDHRGFCTWGIKTGPFAACWANSVLKFFHLFTFMLGRANSLLPQENEKMGLSQPECDTEDWVPGAFKLDHLQPTKPILFLNFSTFSLSCWGGPILYNPMEMRK